MVWVKSQFVHIIYVQIDIHSVGGIFFSRITRIFLSVFRFFRRFFACVVTFVCLFAGAANAWNRFIVGLFGSCSHLVGSTLCNEFEVAKVIFQTADLKHFFAQYYSSHLLHVRYSYSFVVNCIAAVSLLPARINVLDLMLSTFAFILCTLLQKVHSTSEDNLFLFDLMAEHSRRINVHRSWLCCCRRTYEVHGWATGMG